MTSGDKNGELMASGDKNGSLVAISSLILSENEIGGRGALHLSRSILGCSTLCLTLLNLSDNVLKDEGTQ